MACAASGRVAFAVEPRLEALGRQDHRHTVVELGDESIRGTGQNRDGVHLLAGFVAPSLPKPGKGNQAARSRAQEERTPLPLGPGPLIEAVGGNETATVAKALRKEGFDVTPSDLALIKGGDAFGSLTKGGKRPQRIILKLRSPALVEADHAERLASAQRCTSPGNSASRDRQNRRGPLRAATSGYSVSTLETRGNISVIIVGQHWLSCQFVHSHDPTNVRRES